MIDKSYPCATVAQMADIPEEVMPDFLAELPSFIKHARQIKASAPELAAELKRAAPWPWRLLPLGLFEATVLSGLSRATFKNDKKGTITLRARLRDGEPDFYSRTEKLDDEA